MLCPLPTHLKIKLGVLALKDIVICFALFLLTLHSLSSDGASDLVGHASL